MTKISELLDDIRTQDLVLPEFQREYVWTMDQAKQLMVSLVKGYPVGGLLIWKTDKPPELKNVMKLPDKMGTVQVLLDGQRRLTTLNMLLTGAIPAYYRPGDILTDPRDLYFNLDTRDFQYYQSSRMHGESAVLEFKSTLQWDVDLNQANKGLRKSCLKTIAGFMNADGGTLLIGVEDDGNVLGLDNDLNLLGGSRDKFEQTLVNMVTDEIGPALSHYYRMRFEPVDGKLVCVVEADAVSEGVFVKGEKGKEFYVRVGNTTRWLDPADTVTYLGSRT